MKFTITGTGTSQGIPVIGCTCEVCQSQDPRDKRLRTSGVLYSENTTLVFDTGPDFRQQMLTAGVNKLDAVVFTHAHKDHTAGLDDIRPYNFQTGGKSMDVFADAKTIGQLKLEFAYIFEEKPYPGAPMVDLHEIQDQPFQVGDMVLEPIPVWHGRLLIRGYRIGKFAYLTDVKSIPDASMLALAGVEILVINALRHEPHHSHLSLSEAIEVAGEIGATQVYFTHISHLLGRHADIAPTLPPGFQLAYDGLTIVW